jgi:hypothetical protein
MAKNSQYGRWQRVIMQAVLWVVFGGTLALAAFVSRKRTTSLETPLAEPVTFGALSLRLPEGWEREEKATVHVKGLIAQEYDEERRPLRQLWVTQETQAVVKRGPSFYLENVLNLPDSDAKPEPFSFLGSRGVLIVWRGVPRDPSVDPDMVERRPPLGLYACSVLPDGLTVTLQVRGEGAFGPSSRQLIRRVADSMKVADSATRPIGNTNKPE